MTQTIDDVFRELAFLERNCQASATKTRPQVEPEQVRRPVLADCPTSEISPKVSNHRRRETNHEPERLRLPWRRRRRIKLLKLPILPAEIAADPEQPEVFEQFDVRIGENLFSITSTEVKAFREKSVKSLTCSLPDRVLAVFLACSKCE